MGRMRRGLHEQRGAVAVEFALILPLLVLLVVGAIEFGKAFSQYQVLQGAAREGARCAAVQAAELATGLPVCDIQERITTSAGAYTPTVPATVTVEGGSGGLPYACSDRTGRNVTVSWEQQLDIDVPFWSTASITTTIEGVFRCE